MSKQCYVIISAKFEGDKYYWFVAHRFNKTKYAFTELKRQAQKFHPSELRSIVFELRAFKDFVEVKFQIIKSKE